MYGICESCTGFTFCSLIAFVGIQCTTINRFNVSFILTYWFSDSGFNLHAYIVVHDGTCQECHFRN